MSFKKRDSAGLPKTSAKVLSQNAPSKHPTMDWEPAKKAFGDGINQAALRERDADSSTLPPGSSYALPLDRWNAMVNLANHLAKREAEMPLRRRIFSHLESRAWASPQAYPEGFSKKRPKRDPDFARNVESVARRLLDRVDETASENE